MQRCRRLPADTAPAQTLRSSEAIVRGARYSADALAVTIGDHAELLSWHLEDHRTPSGASQQFLFAHLAAPASHT